MFGQLKVAFMIASILMYFGPELPTILEADALTYALDAIVPQLGQERKIYPIAFYSKKFGLMS